MPGRRVCFRRFTNWLLLRLVRDGYPGAEHAPASTYLNCARALPWPSLAARSLARNRSCDRAC
jgi:hypothetical protein